MKQYCDKCEKDLIFCTPPKSKQELALILARHAKWHAKQDPEKIHERYVASVRAGS